MSEEKNLQKGEAEKEMTPEKALVQGRVYATDTPALVFVFTNILYVIVLFLAWYIPMGALVGTSIFVGIFLITILMCQVCVAGYDENHTFMQSLLVYFPVNARRLRHELFLLLWKYIGIQVGITCVPMLVMIIDFRLDKFIMTLGAIALAMLLGGSGIIMVSMSQIKAEV